jgi:hypothetical protein
LLGMKTGLGPEHWTVHLHTIKIPATQTVNKDQTREETVSTVTLPAHSYFSSFCLELP